jgi:hypothetical protein
MNCTNVNFFQIQFFHPKHTRIRLNYKTFLFHYCFIERFLYQEHIPYYFECLNLKA